MEPSDNNTPRYRREEVFNLSRADDERTEDHHAETDESTPLIHSSRIRKPVSQGEDELFELSEEKQPVSKIHIVGEEDFQDDGNEGTGFDDLESLSSETMVESSAESPFAETGIEQISSGSVSNLSETGSSDEIASTFDDFVIHAEKGLGPERVETTEEFAPDQTVIPEQAEMNQIDSPEKSVEISASDLSSHYEDQEETIQEATDSLSNDNQAESFEIFSEEVDEIRPSEDENGAPEYKPLLDLSDRIQGSGIPAFEMATSQLDVYRQSPESREGADALFNAAFHFQKAGLPGKARGLYEAFLQKFPDHPEAGRAQQILKEQLVDAPSEDQIIGRKRLIDSLSESKPKPQPPPIRRGYVRGKTAPPAPSLRRKGRLVDSTGRPEIDFGLPPDERPKTFLGSFIQNRSATQILVGSTVVVLLCFTVVILLLTQRGCYGTESGSFAVDSSSERPPIVNESAPQENNSEGSTNDDASGADTQTEETFVDSPTPAEQPMLVEGGAELDLQVGGFGLQVKFTANEEEANQLAARFRAAGYRCGVVPGPDGGFRVVVGQYPDIDQARNSRSILPDFAPSDNYPVDITQYTN